MTYLKINDIDFSKYVNVLKVDRNKVYTSSKNAAGNTVADYITTKTKLTVGIIALDSEIMKQLQTVLDNLIVTVSFRDPKTAELKTSEFLIPSDSVDYYTIQADNVLFKNFSLTFTEL